ncbi:MAG: M23 family metallopeptidase [Myxococcota bacterium]|nr:M23 family metallopeptidase [Myxococcota bacterium]
MSTRFWIVVLLLVALIGAGVFGLPRLEGTPPAIAEIADLELGHAPQTLVVDVSDADSGLRAVEVRLLSGGGTKTLAAYHFPGSLTRGSNARRERIEVPLDVSTLGLADGEATLVVVARDWSLRNGLSGNAGEVSTSLKIDTKPPRLEVSSGLTYVYRGGSGAVVYRVGEDTDADGVEVGDAFFRGYPLAGDASKRGDRIAIFAIPVEAAEEPPVRIVARDTAGNQSEAGFPVRIFERQFSASSISLSRTFLDSKVRPLAASNGLAAGSPAESFQQVNETLRGLNEQKIRETVLDSSPAPRWQGGFEQMRGSKVTSRFAEKRSYLWNDRLVSKAIHYGFDLASTRKASVTAANGGGVVFADDLGIYGRCVIIDHGLGVHSLYAHLSKMSVSVGDPVTKGQQIGRSGATGLAGGDHLHFAILVGGHYVDPLEWWDPKWVRSHIEQRLRPSGSAQPSG